MIQLEELHPAGYGMFVYSPDVFVSFLKAEKCRARKLLTYFDKHLDVFFRAIGGGVAMPFYRLSTLRYPICVSADGDADTPEGWELVYRHDGTGCSLRWHVRQVVLRSLRLSGVS